MEELRGALEAELWAPYPVHKEFSLRDIAELQVTLSDTTVGLPRYYLRRPLSFFVLYEVSGNPFSPDNVAKEMARRTGGAAPKVSLDQHTLTLLRSKQSKLQNIARLAEAEEGPVDPALLVAEVAEVEGRVGADEPRRAQTRSYLLTHSLSSCVCLSICVAVPGAPLIASATISVLRTVAKYIDLMKTLEHLSTDVFEAMCSYIEYYVRS